MGKHAPAPWEVREVDGLRAVCSAHDWVCTMDSEDEASDEANARLIAAAPEMLAALVLARKAMQINDWHDENNSPSHCRQAFKAVDEAIAKAEGEAP